MKAGIRLVALTAAALAGCSHTPFGAQPGPNSQHPPRWLYEAVPVPGFPTDDVRAIRLSPDRSQVAYALNKDVNVVYVGPVGGGPRTTLRLGGQVSDVERWRIDEPFNWQGDGTALVYTEERYKVFPGEFVDFNLVKTESLGRRLVSRPIAGGEPRTLTDLPSTLAGNLKANPRNDLVAYMLWRSDRKSGPLMLVGGDSTPVMLDEGENYASLTWSPDGSKLAYAARGEDDKGPAEIRVIDVASRKTRTVPNRIVDPILAWRADSGNLQVLHVDAPGGEPPVLRVDTLSFVSGEVVRDSIDFRDPTSKRWYGELSGALPSPDGTKVIGVQREYGESQVVLVSIPDKTVTVVGQPVGLVGWLDDERVLYGEGTGLTPGLYTARMPPATPGR